MVAGGVLLATGKRAAGISAMITAALVALVDGAQGT